MYKGGVSLWVLELHLRLEPERCQDSHSPDQQPQAEVPDGQKAVKPVTSFKTSPSGGGGLKREETSPWTGIGTMPGASSSLDQPSQTGFSDGQKAKRLIATGHCSFHERLNEQRGLRFYYFLHVFPIICYNIVVCNWNILSPFNDSNLQNLIFYYGLKAACLLIGIAGRAEGPVPMLYFSVIYSFPSLSYSVSHNLRK